MADGNVMAEKKGSVMQERKGRLQNKSLREVNGDWIWITGGGWQGTSTFVTEEKAKKKGKDIAGFIDFMVGRQRSSHLCKKRGMCM